MASATPVRTLLLGAGIGLLSGHLAAADPVADFYHGKTVTVLIGVGAGGEYDLQAREVVRFLSKYIPGHPTVVPENMTGAGGLKMANWLYGAAPQDGTYIGMLANNFPAMQAVGADGVMFDASKFNWIGSIAPTVETMATWKTTGVATIDDARKKEVVVGATGKGAITYVFPAMMNDFLGTKFKIIVGYAGGNEVNLAMQRGEVGARNNTWSSWKVTKADWIKNHDINIIAYAGPKQSDLSAPNIVDLAKNDDDRRTMQLITSGCLLGRPLAATPGVPADRVKALRTAFDAVMKDPDFLADTKKAGIDVDPVHGVDMQKTVAEILATPKSLRDRARPLLQ